MSKPNKTYNQRLFKHRIGKHIHFARFNWLRDSMAKLNLKNNKVLELGCFDGKVLDHIEADSYVGYDANWEGGLDLAFKRWTDHPNYQFKECTKPEHIVLEDPKFNVAISQETMEHIPPELIDPFLERLSKNTMGYLFVTVPNEKKFIFFLKFFGKRLLGKPAPKYSFKEFFYALSGNLHKVRRGEHKGFDYAKLVEQIAVHFDVVSVSGLPFKGFPKGLNFTIAIIAKSKDLG